jgi:CheY-like chemotaxis protein
VLVVEDQFLVAEEMRRAVLNLGGDVVGPVPGSRAAIRLIEAEHVDLALLDINLKGEDVYPVATELSRRGGVFIFATGCEPWVIPAEFRNAPRLEKPVTARALTDAIERLGLKPL